MATTRMTTKFDNGDDVELTDNLSVQRYGFRAGSVCGMRVLDGVQAILLGLEEGTQLILVESSDGKAVEIPSMLLRRKA